MEDGVATYHMWDGATLSAAVVVNAAIRQHAVAVDDNGTVYVAGVDEAGGLGIWQLSSNAFVANPVQDAGALPGVGVDLVAAPGPVLHLCVQHRTVLGATLLHLQGTPGAWSTTAVDGAVNTQPGTGCQLALQPDGAVLMSHVDLVRGQVRLSRRTGSPGVWGTDDVAPGVGALGPHDVMVNSSGVPQVVFITAAGGLRRAF